jgi:hypothetical protein
MNKRMKHQKEINLINELIEIAQVIPTATFKPVTEDIPHKCFGLEKHNISFVGLDEVKKCRTSIDWLFSSNHEIFETFTRKKFEEVIIQLIRVLKNSSEKCNSDHYSLVIEELLTLEVKEYEILYDFHGARMNSPSIQFGDFTIYDKEKSFNYLSQTYPALENKEIYLSTLSSKFIIGVKVKARENNKAIEKADKLCESFEKVFGYALSDLTHHSRIGILNFRGWTSINRVVCNNGSMGWGGKNDPFSAVNLDDTFFKDESQGNDKIWSLITKKNKNEIERRLLNAIEWIGKAAYDKDNSKSLVQFVFAIEGMLQLSEKEFITSSIISQLSDWLAFIINDDKEKRKEIAKYFKKVYRKRSAVAHGGSNTIEIEDLAIANHIAKLMVITLLTRSPFKEMTSMKQLSEYMTDLKFQ